MRHHRGLTFVEVIVLLSVRVLPIETMYGKTNHYEDHIFQNQIGDAHTGSDALMVYLSTDRL